MPKQNSPHAPTWKAASNRNPDHHNPEFSFLKDDSRSRYAVLSTRFSVTATIEHRGCESDPTERVLRGWLSQGQFTCKLPPHSQSLEPNAPVDDLWKIVVDFAIDVMAESEVPSLRNAARHVLREIRGKYGDIY